MSLSTTEKTQTSTKFDTGLTTMRIHVENGNPLDVSVAEAVCECYEEGIKQVDIIDALNVLKLSKKK